MTEPTASPVDVTPSARRLTGSLRDIGYEFVSALADIVDNSVAAGATRVDVNIVFDGDRSYVSIADNGHGMTRSELTEALRFGSRRDYERGELGRYGLGLKTASLSQCRCLSVITRKAEKNKYLASKTLDLDHIERTDRWELVDPPETSRAVELQWLSDGPGTVVLWEGLDRVLPEKRPEGGWARRRLEGLEERSKEYLGMVFHRFLNGTAARDEPLTITVGGQKVEAWDPFAPSEQHRIELSSQLFEVAVGDIFGHAVLHRYILPPRERFSSLQEFERLSGPAKWNRQQGLYIYRADRLIQHGGWCGIRAADEHTKFARASLDFQTDLDELFQINVAKMKVTLPSSIRTLLERPIHDLCHRADSEYRQEASRASASSPAAGPSNQWTPGDTDLLSVGTTLMAAALDAGESEGFARVMSAVRGIAPDIAEGLGW